MKIDRTIIETTNHPCNSVNPLCRVSKTFKSAFGILIEFWKVYIMKIRGKVKIPDYVQIRDDQFTLLAYFRADRPEDALKKIGLDSKTDELKKIISELPFGKLKKLDM
jgi:hypothetical protein